MMEPIALARKVYFALLKETSEAQQRILMNEKLSERFGPNALPSINLLYNTHTLADCTETIRRIVERDLEMIERNLQTITELEQMFVKQDEADLQSFADSMLERLRSEKAKAKKAKAKVG